MRKFEDFIEHLATNKGFEPKTVIDVGVAWGTPALYKFFPNAYLILIEALPYFEKYVKRILANREGEYHIVGVSDAPEKKTVRIKENAASLAGMNVVDREGSGELVQEIELDLLDSILNAMDFTAPVILKLDVQGADLRALKGASLVLSRAEVVIAEASLFNEKNLAADIIQYMDQSGFRLYDVCGAGYRPYDQALGQVDLAFVRRGSDIIAHSRWN